MAKRSLDQMIGFVGGVIGLILGALDLFANDLGIHVGSAYGSEILILFSLIGLFGAYLVTSRKKDGGLIMIIIGLAGVIVYPSIGFLGVVPVVPFLILLIAGIISRL